MAEYNAAQKRARDTLKMLMSTKDVRLRQKRTKELPPLVLKVSELSPTAYCALMQMKGSLPSATPAQLDEANRVFGSVIDQATKVAAVRKGMQELDEMGVIVTITAADGDHFFCYPNIDLATEAVLASSLKT